MSRLGMGAGLLGATPHHPEHCQAAGANETHDQHHCEGQEGQVQKGGVVPADTRLHHFRRPLVRHQISLAKAKARLKMLDVVGSIEDLNTLLQECAQTHGDDARITRAVRELLGKANYYATYLLKTNGAAEDEWRPFAERTRQIFRYLAEHQEPVALAQYEQRVEAEFQKTLQRRTP